MKECCFAFSSPADFSTKWKRFEPQGLQEIRKPAPKKKVLKANEIRIRGTDPAFCVVLFTSANYNEFPQTNWLFLAPQMELCSNDFVQIFHYMMLKELVFSFPRGRKAIPGGWITFHVEGCFEFASASPQDHPKPRTWEQACLVSTLLTPDKQERAVASQGSRFPPWLCH